MSPRNLLTCLAANARTLRVRAALWQVAKFHWATHARACRSLPAYTDCITSAFICHTCDSALKHNQGGDAIIAALQALALDD